MSVDRGVGGGGEARCKGRQRCGVGGEKSKHKDGHMHAGEARRIPSKGVWAILSAHAARAAPFRTSVAAFSAVASL